MPLVALLARRVAHGSAVAWLLGLLISALAPSQRAGASDAPRPDPKAAGASSAQREEAAVRQVFVSYRQALLAADGEAVVSLVDTPTIEYYGRRVQDALSLPRRELDRLRAIDMLGVLRLRLEFRRARLEQMSGRDFLALAVERGWISRSTVENAEIAEVRFDPSGSLFRAGVSLKQAPNTPLFLFVKERGSWRMALSSTLGLLNQWFVTQAAQAGLSEQEYVLRLLEAMSEHKVDLRILDGPLD